MQAIPANIVKFLSNHHVVSIAAAADGEIWAACCFYVFDEANTRLIVLTSLKTKHGGLMSRSAKVAAPSPVSLTVSRKSVVFSLRRLPP